MRAVLHDRRRAHRGNPGSERAGFTLIELLVVVAIIALLIAILLPSLSKARGQARMTLGASRMASMSKGMLLYSDDYGETPPFLGRGWEDCDFPKLYDEIWPEGSGKTLADWAFFEDWLMPNMPEYWLSHSADWPAYADVRNGRLFNYARFESLYRCPEFERVRDSRKSQNVFNYTRLVLGRKWFHRADPEGAPPSPYITSPESDNWCGQAGPIVKIGQVHAPSLLRMVMDEYWLRHCAAPVDEFQVAGGGLLSSAIHEQWFAADCMFGTWGSEIGRYHGPLGRANVVPDPVREHIPEVKTGGVAFYDGHVDFERDPLPERYINLPSLVWGMDVLTDWIQGQIFAQRGIQVPPEGFDWGMFLP